MHCPRCGQEQPLVETSFCPKCGLEMSDIKVLLGSDSHKLKAKRKSEINRAKIQGFSMIIFGTALIMILTILRDFFTVPKSLITGSVLIFMIGGMFRMISPYMFGGSNLKEIEADTREEKSETTKLSGNIFDKTLPEAEYHPPIDFGAKKYDTHELVSPLSVTEETTKNLAKNFQTE